jgi:hypothetical protein
METAEEVATEPSFACEHCKKVNFLIFLFLLFAQLIGTINNEVMSYTRAFITFPGVQNQAVFTRSC